VCVRSISRVWLVEGARAESGTRLRGGESQNLEGVRGLKALGVRDLNYRMAYLACTVVPCNNKVTSSLDISLQICIMAEVVEPRSV